MEAASAYKAHPWTKFYEVGVSPRLQYPDISLGGMLAKTAKTFPGHTALLFFGKKITYADLDTLVNRFAHGVPLM